MLTRLLAAFGRGVTGFFAELGRIVQLLQSILRFLPQAFRSRRLIIEQMAAIGVNSLPLVQYDPSGLTFFNANTPEELIEAEQRYWQDNPKRT